MFFKDIRSYFSTSINRSKSTLSPHLIQSIPHAHHALLTKRGQTEIFRHASLFLCDGEQLLRSLHHLLCSLLSRNELGMKRGVAVDVLLTQIEDGFDNPVFEFDAISSGDVIRFRAFDPSEDDAYKKLISFFKKTHASMMNDFSLFLQASYSFSICLMVSSTSLSHSNASGQSGSSNSNRSNSSVSSEERN